MVFSMQSSSQEDSDNSPKSMRVLSNNRIHWLIDICGIDPRIATVDLESVKMKLTYADEGEGWSAEACDQAEVEYKRFLQLYMRYGSGIFPTAIIYTIWQCHKQDPFKYRNDCMKMFGHVIPDFPIAGLRDTGNDLPAHAGIEQTRQHYEDLFGESMKTSEE
jgi:hypothetical protein